ncbi:MAG: hypothetical protein ABI462_05130 [Ignavibacteria bacterium]
MEATINFELAVYLAWFTGILLLISFIKFFPCYWQAHQVYAFDKPKKELLIGLILIALLVLISSGFYYIDNPLKEILSNKDVRFIVNLAIVYSPLWIYLIIKKQGLKTCFISSDKIIFKIIAGIVAALAASFVFLLIRGLHFRYLDYLSTLFNYSPGQLLQTFLEGFVIGFALYRFYAVVRPVWAAAIVAIIFMLAHIPSYVTGMGISVADTSVLIAAHTGISFFIFFSLNKIQDVISIFFIHWFINAATGYQ